MGFAVRRGAPAVRGQPGARQPCHSRGSSEGGPCPWRDSQVVSVTAAAASLAAAAQGLNITASAPVDAGVAAGSRRQPWVIIRLPPPAEPPPPPLAVSAPNRDSAPGAAPLADSMRRLGDLINPYSTASRRGRQCRQVQGRRTVCWRDGRRLTRQERR